MYGPSPSNPRVPGLHVMKCLPPSSHPISTPTPICGWDLIDLDSEKEARVMRSVAHIRTRKNGLPYHAQVSKLSEMESELEEYSLFMDRLTEHVKEWVVSTRHSIGSLQRWGTTFGAVLGFAPLSSTPYLPAYRKFTASLSSLEGLCGKLDDDLQMTFNPLLCKLKAMIEHPQQLLSELHSLEPPRSFLARLWNSAKANDYHRYQHLQSTLLAQLPVLLRAVDRAVALAVRIMMQKQVTFLKAVSEEWIHLFDSLNEEGERLSGTNETLRAWQERSKMGRQMLGSWEQTYLSGCLAAHEICPNTWPETALPVKLSVALAGSPAVDDALAFLPAAPPNFPMRLSHPSSSPSSSWIYLSVTDVVCVLYTVRVLRPYKPPPHDPYQGHSFFELVHGDSFDVLQEHDHPSRHLDLPLCFVKTNRKDCLLKVRARNSGIGFKAGDVGWVLARFVYPDN